MAARPLRYAMQARDLPLWSVNESIIRFHTWDAEKSLSEQSSEAAMNGHNRCK